MKTYTQEERHWEWRNTYVMYLTSPEWLIKKHDVRRRSGGICENCKQAPAQECHHLNYDRLGDELLTDLMDVCKPCHEILDRKRKLNNPRVQARLMLERAAQLREHIKQHKEWEDKSIVGFGSEYCYDDNYVGVVRRKPGESVDDCYVRWLKMVELQKLLKRCYDRQQREVA